MTTADSNPFTVNITAAVIPPTGIPSWASAIPAGQMRLMSTVSNGNVSIANVLPAEWTASANVGNGDGDTGNSGLEIVTSWNGGVWSKSQRSMYWNGGGHTSSSNNGIFEYDFSGDVSPAGWRIRFLSDVADVRNNADYADGSWNSVHTYCGVALNEAAGLIYRSGGSLYSGGSCTNNSHRFNLSTSQFTVLGSSMVDIRCGHNSWYDSVNNYFRVVHAFNRSYGTYNTTTGTWTRGGIGSLGGTSILTSGGSGDTMSGDYDSNRNRYFATGSHSRTVSGSTVPGNRFYTYNPSGTATTVTAIDPTGDFQGLAQASGPAICYDPDRDRYWGMQFQYAAGSTNSFQNDAEKNCLWEINPTTFNTHKHTLTGSGILSGSDQGGDAIHRAPVRSMRKLGNIFGTDCLGMLFRVDQPMRIIRKPANQA